ncbi:MULTISPECIES: STAS domain-containing protein [unclassified Methylophaga]|jgi:ABC-type transporter Mla MlaB component|uniref:STAS domain-containing protein n=1 Tax=unclassified Methylophaga TaxID=2629249 RepID=UPI00259CFBBE|nr:MULTISPECIES: STAS domain-containing protein [unclassified Methylophaga]|tara:strand:- start:706 stop:984 length:279 start_codon:yes stop_codon:yes gene_type:complete
MAESIVEINCAESVTIAQVADLYAQLLMAMAEGQAIQINLSDIERIDTGVIQLFYSFSRNAQLQGLVVIWSNPSQLFCEAVDRLGIKAFYAQ